MMVRKRIVVLWRNLSDQELETEQEKNVSLENMAVDGSWFGSVGGFLLVEILFRNFDSFSIFFDFQSSRN